ncbi:hypothetical protein [Streptosporangium sp. NPDC051022]|uniref:hypothetical protein n=1 Tax=Streptosporangium sp. NPDC051022 TaxID=3155752 RepID=UPI00341EF9E9
MSHPPHDDGHPTLDGRQATRVGVSAGLREVAEFAASRVATTSDEHAAPGDWIDYGRRLRNMTMEILFRCVTMERMNGTPWPVIADRLRMGEEEVRHQFGHADLCEHAAGPGQAVWDILGKTCINPIPGGCAPTPETAAAELDDWYRRWNQPDDHPTDAPERAVSAHL